MRYPDLIIFDMDGTMFDTEQISKESWIRASKEYGYDLTEELFNVTIGINLQDTRKIFMDHFGAQYPIDDIYQRRIIISEDIIKERGVPIKAGLNELLEYLEAKSVKKAVATSTNHNRAHDLLKRAGVIDAFDFIICGDQVTRSKPDPEIFQKAAGKLSCSPEKTMVIEDSQAGIEAAASAGMTPVMVPDILEPDEATKMKVYKLVYSLTDVIEVLESLTII